jgi:hypothetical protein
MNLNLTDPWVLIVIGVVLLGLGYGIVQGLSKKSQSFFRIIGIGVIVFGLLSYSGISLFGEEQAPVSTVGDAFEVTGSESHSYLTVDNTAKTFTWAVYYNSTTQTIVGATQATLNFSIDRGLGTVGLVQTYADVASVPSITNSTSGLSYSVLTKTSDEYNAIWTRLGGTTSYEFITLTIPETSDGVTASLNVTLNPAAVGSMDVYDTTNVGITIGGEHWILLIMLVDNSI